MSSRRRRTTRASVWRRVLVVLGLAAAFLAGVGLGGALKEGPAPAGQQTIVRTLTPLTVTPVPTETVTVTISNR